MNPLRMSLESGDYTSREQKDTVRKILIIRVSEVPIIPSHVEETFALQYYPCKGDKRAASSRAWLEQY